MVIRTLFRTGGIYDIYVNDQLVRTFDYVLYTQYPRNLIQSVVSGKYYVSDAQGYINFDCWAQDDVPYGMTSIRFEYKGPSNDPLKTISPGLVIDYIDFIPYD